MDYDRVNNYLSSLTLANDTPDSKYNINENICIYIFQ